MFKSVFPILSFPKTLAGVAKALFDLNKQIATYWGGLVSDSPVVAGKLLSSVSISTLGWNKIAHGLGRVPNGASIVAINYATSSYGVLVFSPFGRTSLSAYAPTRDYIYVYVGVSPPEDLAVNLWVF